VTKLSSTGAVLATVTSAETGIIDADGIAVDSLGNAWIADPVISDIVEIPSSGSVAGGVTRYIGGALSHPVSLAFDGFGDLWSTSSYSIVEFSNSGAVLSGTNGYGDSPLIAPPGGIAIDGSGSAWVANYSGILKITRSGNVVSGIPGFLGSGGSYQAGIGIESSGNVWLADTYYGAVLQLFNTGAGFSDWGLLINGIPEEPLDIAVDGSGNAWVTIPGANCAFGISRSGGQINGACYTGSGTVQSPSSIVADGSGNLWMVNAAAPRSVTEMIGAATPVITPNAAGLPAMPTADGSSNLGTRP
jgi:streptogramin lyase